MALLLCPHCDPGDSSPDVIPPSQTSDVATGITTGQAGNVVIAGRFGGRSIDLGAGPVSADDGGGTFIASYSPAGDLLWSTVLDSPNAHLLARASDGGFFVASGNVQAGVTPGFPREPHLIRLDRDGAQSWEKSFSASGSVSFLDLEATPSGGVAMLGLLSQDAAIFFSGGWVESFSELKYFVAVLDAEGEYMWHSSMTDLAARHLAVGTDGSIYLAGEVAAPERYNGEALAVFVRKLDPSGEKVWERRFEGSQKNTIDSLVLNAREELQTAWLQNDRHGEWGTTIRLVDLDPLSGTSTITSTVTWRGIARPQLQLLSKPEGLVFVSADDGAIADPDAPPPARSGETPAHALLAIVDVDAEGHRSPGTQVGEPGDLLLFPTFVPARSADDSVYVVGTVDGEPALQIDGRVITPAAVDNGDSQIFLVRIGPERKVEWAKGLLSTQ